MKSILIFVDWYIPAYKAGGPVQSIANLVNHFKHQFDISIMTSDRDLGDNVPYSDVRLNAWIQKDGYRIMYLSPEFQKTKFYKNLFEKENYDVVYFNSLFSVPFTLRPLFACSRMVKKIVLAPRGMLGAGALQIKFVKKRVFISIARILGFFKNVTWHATAESERDEIIENFGQKSEVRVAPNLTSLRLRNNIIRDKRKGEVDMFFVSRIARKKNLLQGLQMLKSVASDIKINYFIIGPIDEPDYWSQCVEVTNQFKENIHIKYLGAIPNYELVNYLTSYHFLFLPTLHENYGHAIIESLQCGCPVIISDRTPWRNLQKIDDPKSDSSLAAKSDHKSDLPDDQLSTINNQSSAGWDLPLEKPEQFVEVIEYCARMGQEEYNAMSGRAFVYAEQVTSDPAVIEANRRLFA